MYSYGEPLVLEEERRHGKFGVANIGRTIAGCFLGVACVAMAAVIMSHTGRKASSWSPIADFGPSGQWCQSEPAQRAAHIDVDAVRLAAKAFVASLGDDIKGQTYYPDASLQQPQWAICTIVQQCLKPKYGLAVGLLAPASRTRFYDLLALVLSDESYKRINVQQLSNLLLGEMQEWAVSCEGQCAELNDPKGLLPNHLLLEDRLDSKALGGDVTLAKCAELNANEGRKTFWSCNQSPRMLHHGNIDTETGRYYLGNVFAEQSIHARNRHFDFVSVYGSLEPGEAFGFRYSGHHFDLSFSFADDGKVTDLPTFLGHNPLIVPQMSPPLMHDDGGLATAHEDYNQWRNMAGVPQFPDAVKVVVEATALLTETGYIPLRLWDSTPATGGLTLKDGKDMRDFAHLDLSKVPDADFETLWALIDYTLEFSRGARSRPEKAAFRKSGRLCWTSVVHPGEEPTFHLPKTASDLVKARQFFYVRAETDELLYFGMINSLFSLMLEAEPSNHLHSILIPKSYLA